MTHTDDTTVEAPLAEIRNLRVEVGGRAIVDGVSLQARPGKVTALVGASGSGKTTTGLALLGEYPPGARVTGDVRLAADGPVGYVPQHPAAVLNPARRITALLSDIARAQVRHLPRGRRPANVSCTPVPRPNSRTPRPCCAATRTSSPGASSNASSSPRRCCSGPGSSSPTSPPPVRTP